MEENQEMEQDSCGVLNDWVNAEDTEYCPPELFHIFADRQSRDLRKQQNRSLRSIQAISRTQPSIVNQTLSKDSKQ